MKDRPRRERLTSERIESAPARRHPPARARAGCAAESEETMVRYEVHTHATAPVRSRPLLEALQRNLGMVPNLAASMAESPELLEGFLHLREIFYNGSFTPAEVQ